MTGDQSRSGLCQLDAKVERCVVGIDAGGSGIRLDLLRPDGSNSLLRHDGGVRMSSAGIDLEHLLATLGPMLVDARGQAPDGILAAAIGITGLPDVFNDVPSLAEAIRRALECQRVVVAADAVTAHFGALGGRSGAVVVAGTGVVALGTDYVDHWNRVDGWGHLLGDDGGGVWIGMLGLRAAFRSLDGRPGGSPELCSLAEDRFWPLRELGLQLYTSADRAGRLASFAPDVIQAAARNVRTAANIVERAGEHLATAAATAVRNVAPRVACSGGIFDASEVINASFRRHLADMAPGSEVVSTLGSPLDGATALARLAATRPREVPHNDQFITMLGDPV